MSQNFLRHTQRLMLVGGSPMPRVLMLRVPYARLVSVGLLTSQTSVVRLTTIIQPGRLGSTPLRILIKRVAAPRPVLGVIHQTSFHGIGVDVTELFDFLLSAPNVEVIESPLPELRGL